MKRALQAIMLLALLAAAPPRAQAGKAIILGVDGLDPGLLTSFMSEGILPNFSRLAAEGDMSNLETTAAAQSPVAWSTFITGMDPGGHGIFDFLHRDPATMLPYLSISRAVPAGRALEIGPWVFPLSKGGVELLRKGKSFWEILGAADVPTTIFRMPVNFPPVEAPRSRQLSGMGTPDIQGTSGTFSFFTERLPPGAAGFTGGKAFAVQAVEGRVTARLPGPENPFRRPDEGGSRRRCTAKFSLFLDRDNGTALFEVGESRFVLKEKEWSEWIPVDFEAVPFVASFSAVGRFYLKQVSPFLELYVSPLQINPRDPVMPISSPPEWSGELCACLGYFYTQELPQDTKAFTHRVFSGREFWDQLVFVNDEARLIFEHLLAGHEEGLLFFYFGSVDQGSHMLWHFMDEKHPGFTVDDFLAGGIRRIYRRMDDMLGFVLDAIDEDTLLIVMSDHGFAPFYHGVNLNSWLAGKGYVTLRDPGRQGEYEFFMNVDWSRTKAYALGLNGLYVNLRGREKNGVVAGGEEYGRLLDSLERDLLAMQDPSTGDRTVTRVTRPARDFRGPERQAGPDLIVGYNRGYRSSWENSLGEFPREVIVDNTGPWSGDHCMDSRLVPGVLLANRRITMESPHLYDLTVSVLDEFGVTAPPWMTGKDCLADRGGAMAPALPQTGRQDAEGEGDVRKEDQAR